MIRSGRAQADIVMGFVSQPGPTMNQTGANPYLKTKVMTASPEQLRLMLYEGAVKFCRQAKTALGQGDFEGSYTSMARAQKIVLELGSSLNHTAAPELCDKLNALYTYLYRRMVDANLTRQIAPIDECIKLLEYETETWQMMMRQMGQMSTASSAAAASAAPLRAPAGAGMHAGSLSLNG
jgi:flagellar secretion chaperone FliS